MRQVAEKLWQNRYFTIPLLIVAALILFEYGLSQQGPKNPIPELSMLTGSYNLYQNDSAGCQTSQLLANSVSMTLLCTDAFTLANQTSTSTPHAIALFYYAFRSQDNATSYINSIIEFENTTPWPNNIAALGKIQKYRGIKLYETTEVIVDPTNYTHVNTIYAQTGNEIIGVSALSISSSNFISPEGLDANILYNWYLLFNKSSG